MQEAIEAGVTLERIFVVGEEDAARWGSGTEVVAVTEPVMERLTPTGDAWGPVAVAQVPAREPVLSHPVLVAVDIADPGNLGTMIRSAAAFGYDVVVVGGTDPWSPKVLRSGAGGHFRSNVSRQREIPDREWVAAVVEGGRPPGSVQVAANHALLIGSEAHGLPRDVIEAAHQQVSIAMHDVESLNAASAAAILMFAFAGSNPSGG